MKAIIFAGGVGTRLWPLSRKRSPKQFEKVIGEKSTLQMTFERIKKVIKPQDIYIATGKMYKKIIKKQIPQIPPENVIGEPMKKDVGPAVALMTGLMTKKNPKDPIIILWSDHLIKKEDKFHQIIKVAEKIINEEQNKIIFIGQKPRFPNQNLGWIELSKAIKTVDGIAIYGLKDFRYRPSLETAKKYLKDKKHCWNLGYFVSTPQYIYSLFKRFAPKIYDTTEKILGNLKKMDENLEKFYNEMPEISFDNAVLEQIDGKDAYVISEDIGWSDVGAWEALKEALETKKEDNITLGKVHLEDCFDNLVYNYEQGKLVVGIDLIDSLIVNTNDVLLVAKKTSVPKIKKFVESLEKSENRHLA